MDVTGSTKKSKITECGEECRGGRYVRDKLEELLRCVAECHTRGCGEAGVGLDVGDGYW